MTEGYPSQHEPSIFTELELKHKTDIELYAALFEYGGEWSDEERAMVMRAYDLATELHSEDRHKALPYSYHLLRNANRAMGYLGITDPEVVVAIILHDTVEDHPKALIKAAPNYNHELAAIHIPDDPIERQEVALSTLEHIFSPKVANLVALVTNPPGSFKNKLSYEESLQNYAEKVRAAVETFEGWVVKFVDWEDNGLGIIHNDPPEAEATQRHRKRKYGLVLPIFRDRFYQPDIQSQLSAAAKAYVEHQFTLGLERLTV